MQRVLSGCVGLLHNVSGCRRGLVFGVESVKLDVKCVSVVGCVLIVHWLKVLDLVFFFFFFFFYGIFGLQFYVFWSQPRFVSFVVFGVLGLLF
jgi:hypothetical protein